MYVRIIGCMSALLYVHVTHTQHTHTRAHNTCSDACLHRCMYMSRTHHTHINTHTPQQGFAHVCLGLYVCTFCLCQWTPVCAVPFHVWLIAREQSAVSKYRAHSMYDRSYLIWCTSGCCGWKGPYVTSKRALCWMHKDPYLFQKTSPILYRITLPSLVFELVWIAITNRFAPFCAWWGRAVQIEKSLFIRMNCSIESKSLHSNTRHHDWFEMLYACDLHEGWHPYLMPVEPCIHKMCAQRYCLSNVMP